MKTGKNKRKVKIEYEIATAARSAALAFGKSKRSNLIITFYLEMLASGFEGMQGESPEDRKYFSTTRTSANIFRF